MTTFISESLMSQSFTKPEYGGLKGGEKDVSFQEIFHSIQQSPGLDTLVQRVYYLFLKVLVTFHDLLIVPVYLHVQPTNPYAEIAKELLKTCSFESVNQGAFCAEDLTSIFVLQKLFFCDIVKSFIAKVEGEESRHYQEKIWKWIEPKFFVETYLIDNPNNFTIFRNVVLKSYI